MTFDLKGTLIGTVITKSRIYLLSDGRITNNSTGESRNDHSKVHSINNKVGLLVAGWHISKLPTYIKEQTRFRNKESVQDVSEITQEGLKHAWNNFIKVKGKEAAIDMRLFAFVVGFDESNSPRLFYIDNMTDPRFEIKERDLFATPTDFEISIIAHGNSNNSTPSQTFTKHIENNISLYQGIMNLDEMIVDAFNRTKNKLAENSDMIGGQTFINIIDKDKGLMK